MEMSTINWSGRILNKKQIVTGERYVLVEVDEFNSQATIRECRVANTRDDKLTFSTDMRAGHKPIELIKLGIESGEPKKSFYQEKEVRPTMSALFVNLKQATAYARRLQKGVYCFNEFEQLKEICKISGFIPKVKFPKGSMFTGPSDIRYFVKGLI